MANVSFDPSLTLNGQNTFQKETQGWIQGAYMDDPTARMWLLSGIVDSTVTQPVWGGMAITENVASLTTDNRQGSPLVIAADNAGITGFTTFNQAHNMIIVPGNKVPISVAGQNIAYFRLGSNIRLPVQVDPTLVASLEGNPITQQVSWDFTNQKLIAYSSGAGALNVKVIAVNENSKYVTYNSSTGNVSWSYGPAALIQL